MTRPPSVFTTVPGQAPIELVAYYDEFASYYPNCEPQTKRWFVENVKEGWTILDCGANVGCFSILFARLAPNGHVYAFEPTETHEMLVKNLAYHGLKNVTPLRVALGNKVGEHEDGIFRIWGKAAERKVYPFTTVDRFVSESGLARVDCIKIDVDSFDFEVLQGCEAVLRKHNPFVMVELNHALSQRNQSSAQALEWLARRGYEECAVFDGENFLLKSGHEFRGRGVPLNGLRVAFAGESSVVGRPRRPDRPSPVPERAHDAGDAQGAAAVLAETLVPDLHRRLGFGEEAIVPGSSPRKPLRDWRAETDDAPIFRYLYRNFRPKRHLEFGTWQGAGALYALEECDATVWTVNLLAGEAKADGAAAYGLTPDEAASALQWARRMGLAAGAKASDSIGFIGRLYLQAGLGHRVCQIYSDSRKWDISGYSEGFFDSVLVDGGHAEDIVWNDTVKALKLVREGGLLLWHDFCPDPEAEAAFETTRGVNRAIRDHIEFLRGQTTDLFWIKPSMILAGIRAKPTDASRAELDRALAEAAAQFAGMAPAPAPALSSAEAAAAERMPPASLPTPAAALWNQRHVLAAARDRIFDLARAVGSPENLAPPQWAQLIAVAMEFRPDLIVDLGRGKGNSTAAFAEAANRIGPQRCKVLSICLSRDWTDETEPRLSRIVPDSWFQPLQVVEADILAYDFRPALVSANRVMVFWDVESIVVAERVLGGMLPQIAAKPHLVAVHDISDTRYLPAEQRLYGERGLWGGRGRPGARFRIGWMDSASEHAISLADFASRNGLTLFSSDHSFHTELAEKASELRSLLGSELFSLNGHWFWFSLNECEGPYTFPIFVPPSEPTVGDSIRKIGRRVADRVFPPDSERR